MDVTLYVLLAVPHKRHEHTHYYTPLQLQTCALRLLTLLSLLPLTSYNQYYVEAVVITLFFCHISLVNATAFADVVAQANKHKHAVGEPSSHGILEYFN